jgi:hypothetical protein
LTSEEIELLKAILAELREIKKAINEVNDSIVVLSP